MDVLNEFLKTKGLYTLVMILFFLGVYGMVLSKNYMKKLMAMNVMQVAVIYFYLCFAQKDGAMIPIQNGITTDPSMYINPLPHGLMLTAIVVSLGTTGGRDRAPHAHQGDLWLRGRGRGTEEG